MANTTSVTIPEFKKEEIIVTIAGDCDLILCKMTDSAQTEIKDSQTKTGKSASKAKEAINMFQRLIESVHWMDPVDASVTGEFEYVNLAGEKEKVDVSTCFDVDEKGKTIYSYTEQGWNYALQNNRIGYDASGIKKGLCDAAVRVLGESKSTIINANVQVIPEKRNLVPIEFKDNGFDESIITNWKGNAFLTYRNVFNDWSAKFRIEYLPSNISMEQVIALVQAMGFAGGIGAHRVGLKGGTNGKFHVAKVDKVIG